MLVASCGFRLKPSGWLAWLGLRLFWRRCFIRGGFDRADLTVVQRAEAVFFEPLAQRLQLLGPEFDGGLRLEEDPLGGERLRSAVRKVAVDRTLTRFDLLEGVAGRGEFFASCGRLLRLRLQLVLRAFETGENRVQFSIDAVAGSHAPA